MIWGISICGVRVICLGPIPSITVRNVASTLAPTSLIWPRRAGSQYTHRVINLAVRIVVEDGVPYRPASWHLWRDHRVFVPFATIQNWVEAGGKKGAVSHGHRVP